MKGTVGVTESESNNLLSQIRPVVHRALQEDMGSEDVTTLSTIPEGAVVTGRFLARQPGVVAGLEVAQLTFSMLDSRVRFRLVAADGDSVEEGDILATVKGRGRALLGGERVALNFLQRMSGIATITRQFVDAVKGTSAVILDTRKTAPGLRFLDKWAVRLGGGQNHRFGLYDMVLIKDNHIAAVGSIAEAVRRVRSSDSQRRPIEVETKIVQEVREALKLRVDRIMLDNMSPDQMREAVQLVGGAVPLEASGKVTLGNVAEIAATGIDYISVGMLTHSPEAMDITFLLDGQNLPY